MNDRGFIFVHVLIFSVVGLFGVVALLLPEDKYTWMLEHMFVVGKGSGIGRGLQRRLAGIILALMGFFAVRGDLHSIYWPRAGEQPPRAPNPTLVEINAKWLPFMLGLLAVSFGFFVAFNPEPLLQWTQRKLFPGVQASEGILWTSRIALRVIGALMVYASTDLFGLWLRH